MSAPPPPPGPYGPQQPGPYPGQPQGGPQQPPQGPPPGYGQQPPQGPPPGYGHQPPQGPPPGYGHQPPQGPPPGGPYGPYGGAPQGPPPPGYGQQPPQGGSGRSGGRKGLIIGGAIGGVVILIGAIVAVAVSSGSSEYGTLAEDQCETILPEEIFDNFGGGESPSIEGEFEENGGTDDAHALECTVDFGSARDVDHSAQVMVEIHEPGSGGYEDMLDEMTEEVEDLEADLEPGELGRPSENSGALTTDGEAMWEHSSLGDEGVVLAVPSDEEFMPDMSMTFFRDQNAFFGIFAGQEASASFEPETGLADIETLGSDVRAAVLDVNEAP